jgi:hypothetical protein
MWLRFNITEIDQDFARIAATGFNTVRIITQAVPGCFDYPQPTQSQLSQLNQVFVAATSHSLKVHLSLFDWWGVYSDISGSKQWAQAIISPYSGSNNLGTSERGFFFTPSVFIDLQNEVDATNTNVTAWVKVQNHIIIIFTKYSIR